MKVAIAAAGTGGHVYPALGVADELRSRGLAPEDIVFFGGDRMEATAVPAAGYPFVPVEIHGIRRSLSLDNVKLPLTVARARSVIADEITDRGLRAMAVFGGYIAGPAALAARRTRIPIVLHEANAVPGVANRLVAPRAARVYTTFAAAAAKLPHAEIVGSPLRSEIASFDRETLAGPARERYGIPSGAVVVGVVGGSLGARYLNDVAARLAAVEGRRFTVLHITGPTLADEVADAAADDPDWITMPFEDAMQDVYAASDLVLCRSGAMTVCELEVSRTPAVIVPLPAGGGYQEENAAELVAAGGAVVVPQGDPDAVVRTVTSLLGDPASLAAMRAPGGHEVDHRKAAATIADGILEVARA